MNIVHVVEAWKGGIASYVEALIKDQLARGYRVQVLADTEQLAADARDLGVPVVGYQSSRKPWKFKGIAAEIAEEVASFNAQVVHCHSTFPGLYVRLRAHSAKVVYTPHSWSFLKQDVGLPVRLVYQFVERVLAKRCHRIVCMSLEEVASAGRAGLPADKLSLVYSGVPDLCGKSAEFSNRSHSGPMKVGFFGRFDYQKGFDLLEDLAPMLGPEVELHVFGGAVRGGLGELHPRFVNHGWIEHKRMPEEMLAMDVILIPSRWEGFALTPLEAMRVGRPVIISNQTSLPEVVIHGFNGIVLSDYSAARIASVLAGLKRVECERMGRNARVVFEQAFRFDDFLNMMDAIYHS